MLSDVLRCSKFEPPYTIDQRGTKFESQEYRNDPFLSFFSFLFWQEIFDFYGRREMTVVSFFDLYWGTSILF